MEKPRVNTRENDFQDTEQRTLREAVISDYAYLRFKTVNGSFYELTRNADGGYTLKNEKDGRSVSISALKALLATLREGDPLVLHTEQGKEIRTSHVTNIYRTEEPQS